MKKVKRKLQRNNMEANINEKNHEASIGFIHIYGPP
jgi:hypothetical protein